MQKHGQCKSVSCVSCGKRFPMRSTLQRLTHLQTGEGPYECAVCLETFFSSSFFIRFKQRHAADETKALAYPAHPVAPQT